MLLVFTTRWARNTFHHFLETWKALPPGSIVVRPYESAVGEVEVEAGAVVFTDFERLEPAQFAHVQDLAEAIASAAPELPMWNRPTHRLDRAGTLERLHTHGLTPQRAFRPGEEPADLRFPVIVRIERSHMGPARRLITDRRRLLAAIASIRAFGYRREDILITEFVETKGADGRYRKYGAFRIGDMIVPQHVIHARTWMVKGEAWLFDDQALEEEIAYVTTNPHEQALREIFEAAHIDYGRIDYSMLDGRPVVWEINTNPNVMWPPGSVGERRSAVTDVSVPALADGFRSIDGPARSFTIEVPPWPQPSQATRRRRALTRVMRSRIARPARRHLRHLVG